MQPSSQTPILIDAPPAPPRPGVLDAVLLAAVLGVMTYGIGGHGLYEPHEGHFAGVGREMVTRGDWVTPHLNGAPYLNKPPLLYWMIASSYSLFGINTFAARLPLALIGWCGVLLAWHWSRRLFGAQAGRCAAIMLAVSAGWYLFCHQLLIDALLSVILLLSSYALWLALQNPASLARWLAFYAACGLSVMAKGPIGFAFMALTLFGVLAWRKQLRLLLHWHHLAGVAVFAAVIAPWCVMLENANPGALRYMIVNENFKRAIDQRWPPDYSVVKVSPHMYVLIAIVWMAPWSLLLPQVGSFAWKKSRVAERQESPRAVADALLILSFGVLLPILFFLPMSSRLVYYCLPAVLPFSILASGWWVVSREDCYTKGRRSAGWMLLLGGVAIFSAGFWAPEQLQKIPLIRSMPMMLTYIAHLAFALGVSFMVGGIFLLLRRPLKSIAMMGLCLAVTQLYNVSGFAEFDQIWSSRKTVDALKPLTGEDVIWITEGSKEIGAAGGIAYFLGRHEDGRARCVLVMKDTPGREPPIFPGAPPKYLIDRQQLAELWKGPKPIVYLTDFQRTDWVNDPPNLPPEPLNEVTPKQAGNRKVYLNSAAMELWEKSR